jgi:DNA-binding beta-propeller fold protein YncE
VNQIASIALEDDQVEITQVPGSSHAFVQFAVAPGGGTLVASTELSGHLMVFDLAVPARPRLLKSVEVGAMAFDPAFTPDGRFVYVPVKSRNEVAVIETAGWTVVDHITDPSFAQPHQVVFSADGALAFVTNNNKSDHMADPAMGGGGAGHEMHAASPSDKGSLVVVDTKTRKVVKAIELGKNLTGMNTRARR